MYMWMGKKEKESGVTSSNGGTCWSTFLIEALTFNDGIKYVR